MKLTLIALTMIVLVVSCESCRSVDTRRPMSYSLIRPDARSIASVITRRRFANVEKCKDFAEHKRALAINFERFKMDEYWEPNCILLYCPETNGLHQLVNASGVDYYSSYSNKTYSGNVSLNCIENVGLFLTFSEKKNFTNARDSCSKVNGILAGITSDARTRGLASIIGNNLVFVGLSNQGNDRIWKDEFGQALACFEYRAWNLDEPSHSRGCVGLIQMSYKNNPTWQIVPCNVELPFICEIPHSQEISALTSMRNLTFN